MSETALDPVKSDPGVIAAEHRRDDAREAFDAVNEVWVSVTGTRAIAEMRGRTSWAEMAKLREAEAQATRAREAAWAKVVAANGEISRAHAAARYRAELAEHELAEHEQSAA